MIGFSPMTLAIAAEKPPIVQKGSGREYNRTVCPGKRKRSITLAGASNPIIFTTDGHG